MKNIISTTNAPDALGPYSQGIDAGSIEITSGQVPIDPATSAAVEGAIAKQPRQSLTNVQAVLAAAGLTMDNVIKNTVFLKNMNDFATMKEVYATFFTGNPPARSGSSAHKSNGQNSLKKRLNSGLSSSLPFSQSRTNRFTGGNTVEYFVLCKGCGFPAKEMRKAVAGFAGDQPNAMLALSERREFFSLC